MKSWRRLASRTVVQDRWLSLRADRCELPNGTVVDPYYVIEDSDWVHIFAQDEQGRVLLVKQYRYAADVVCVELPGGAIDAGETALQAAKRELQEETGYHAKTWTKIAKIFANPARQTNAIYIYLAAGLSRDSEQSLDEAEEIVFGFSAIAEIKTMIAQGKFCQSLHIASFYLSLDVI